MKTTCPKFVSTRWLSMTRVTAWMKKHRVRVLSYLDEKKPACTPTADWWILLICLDSVANILAETVMCLQGLTTLLYQQLAQFKVLAVSLLEMCTVAGPLSTKQLTGLDSGTVRQARTVFSGVCRRYVIYPRPGDVCHGCVGRRFHPKAMMRLCRMLPIYSLGRIPALWPLSLPGTPTNQRYPDELPPVLTHTPSPRFAPPR